MLGLAVISGSNLVDYQIQLRKEAWTPHKKELILASLHTWFERYSITNVALSIPYEKQSSSQTKELLESFKSHFSEKKIPVTSYPAKVLSTLCQEAKTKKEVMRVLAGLYPELSFQYMKEMGNKNKYYVKLFEAVGVATIHSERFRGNRET
jgi:hypothetical protein